VHIGMKAGIAAMWVKEKYGIPYVVSEQWTGFLPESDSRFEELNLLLRLRWTKLMKNASLIFSVSRHLSFHLKRLFGQDIEVAIVPNVVNDQIFSYSSTNVERSDFVFISGDPVQKNGEDIMKAFKICWDQGEKYKLHVFGPHTQKMEKLIENSVYSGYVTFYGEVPQDQISNVLKKAIALIVYSRFETFGCVVIEALACGTPVIGSDIPTMRELVVHGENGVIIESENPELLSSALKGFKVKQCNEKISEESIEKFNYTVVARLFDKNYQKVILRN